MIQHQQQQYLKQAMTEEGNHVRLEQLFAPEGNGDLSYFYASNKIVSNPGVMVDLLRQLPDLSLVEQEKLLQEIVAILDHVSTNAYALNRLKQPAVTEILIDLIPNYVDNYVVFNKLLTILDHVLRMSSTDQKLIEKSIKKLIVELHAEEGVIDSKSLFGTINILKSFLNCKIGMDKEPDKMIVFHGGNGLEIRPSGRKDINWLFSNGMSIYFWVNIENIKFGTQASLPKFFTFYSLNNGGLECYLIDNKIYYRTVGSKYNSPKIGSNGICLGQLEPKKWNFIGVEHEGPKRILGRSHIIFHINDKKTSFNLSPPSISSKQKMKIVFFDKIYCKTSSICVLPYFAEPEFVENLNKNKNSIDLIKNPKAYIFEQRQGGLYERNDLGFCADPLLHRNKQMSFETILPLFHIYKFTKQPTSYPILNDLLELFVLYLYKSPSNQIEAHQKNYPHMISELIKSLPNLGQKFNEETVNTLLHIKQTITNPELLKQYHGQLLWTFVDSKISISSKQMLLEIIKNNFTQNVSYFSNIIGLDQMLNVIMKMATKTSRCCEKHFKIMIKRFDKDLLDSENEKFGENEIALQYILKIVELEVQNQKVNIAQEIYKLCRVLSLKFSPCFTLSFMGMIKRVLTQKINQKLNSGQAKKIIEYLMTKKVSLMFLHVIQNSFFAEIKAESVKILYTLLLKKASINEQEEISYRLSRALWKINEDHESQAKIQSLHTSPHKNKGVQILPQDLPDIKVKAQSSKSNHGLRMSSISSEAEDSGLGVSQSYSKNKASSIFKQVGPQAPPLTNKMKGSKTFSFNFMSESQKQEQNKKTSSEKQIESLSFQQKSNPKSHKVKAALSLQFNADQVMQQQKTNDNQLAIEPLHRTYSQEQQAHIPKVESQEDISIKQQPPKKKKMKGLSLNIDTEQINKMYTFGGEKGQQIVISEEEQEVELDKIRKLARICVAAMKGEKYQASREDMESKGRSLRPVLPPATTSNKALKAREPLIKQHLKLIDQESEPESAMKKPTPNIKNINTSIPSPNFGSRKSKSPTSIASINEENLVVLYNSLMENCVTIPNYDFAMPSIMYIFFSWIPQTNLEVKFLYDLGLILQNDNNFDKIRILVKMSQFYDFLFQLAYKALLFEQMGEKRLYTQKLEQIVKKVFAFIFREQPQSLDKFTFIIDWSQWKSKQYHSKCLFLTTRYIFFLIMDAIEQDLFSNSKNDKLMERNFQYLGITVSKFCKFLPVDSANENGIDVRIDQYDRIIFQESFSMILSIAPYFTSPWVDYLICEKYYILFKKFFCTDWYTKNLRQFQLYLAGNNIGGIETMIKNFLSSQYLILCAQSQYYLKNSFIFTLIEINKCLFIDKTQRQDNQCTQRAQIIWHTLLVILFAETTRQKNQKNNSQFTTSFLKNCKVFCTIKYEKAAMIVHLLKTIRQTVHQNSSNMTNSGIHDGSKDLKSSQGGPKYAMFADYLIDNYVNEKLFQGENTSNFQNFKLNFREVWIPGESHEAKIKSQLHSKFIDKQVDIEEKTSDYIEMLSNLIQQETERATNVQILVEAANRNIRSSFRKLWKNLRIFGSAWTHPQLSFQNHTLYNKNLFTYERYEASKFYKLRICKHMSKYRLRYLLKPVMLFEPAAPSQNNDNNYEKEEIGLHKALLYNNENKLLLGNRLLSWLFQRNQYGSTFPTPNPIKQLDIMMEFKKVRLIKTLTIRHGFLGIINDKLIFINSHYKEPPSHLSIAEYKLKEDKNFFKLWPLEFIKELFKRRYVNRRRALEINFIYGKTVMLQFYENDLEDFIKKILKLKGTKCPNLVYNGNKTLDAKKIYQSQGLLKKWSTYEISNFEYLMQINNLAGRSYCDLTQYPVMPWVLVNFDNKLTISDESSYRNLTLPMGALGSVQRTQGFRQRFQNMGEIEQERFHYGTHYSSPAIIYHFLVRLSPFTEGAVLLQSGKFDFADRLFFSIADSFKNATSQYSDVRELIPEMYTFPESYLNINKLDLGVMQNQKRVHNVELPGWARDNPYLYVTKMRKAFEELAVSKNVGKWIDLIFGYKQKGEEAARNLNCYVHLTYEDSIKFQQLKDDKTVKAIETQILNFGQTPSQLFTKPHQERVSPLTLPMCGTICDPNVEPRIYRPSRHASNIDLLKEEKQEFNAMRQSGESIIHMRWFKDSRLVFIRRNGEMLFYKWQSAQPGSNSKVPFQCAIEKQRTVARISKNVPENMQYFDGSLKTDSFPIEFINNGHHMALGGLADGKLLIIDTDTNSIESYTEHSSTICCMRSDLKDNFLMTGDITGRLVVWRIINNHKLTFYYSNKDHHKQITSIFISYDLKCVFTSSTDGCVYGYNIITGRKMKVYHHPSLLPISNVVISTSPLPVVVLFCNVESIIYCYSINGQLIQRVTEKEIEHFLSPVLIRDTLGFEHVAYGNEHGETIFRTLPYLDNPIKHVVAKDAAVNRICLSKSSKFVIVGCSDGELSVITAPDNNPK